MLARAMLLVGLGAACTYPLPAPPADASSQDASVQDGDVVDADVVDGAPMDASTSTTCSEYAASGPITLSAGQTVACLRITTTTGPCVLGTGVENVRITDNQIGPCGSGTDGVGVRILDATDVRIDHNTFDDVASAVYIQGGDRDIVIDHNVATRIRGPSPRGQLVRFNDVRGPGHRILCNVSDQPVPGFGDGPEAHVMTSSSAGTTASPIEVAYNKIRGGGPSQSGGGILVGVDGGENFYVHDNILIEPGQFGLALYAGTNVRFDDNQVWNGVSHAWDNIGMYSPNGMPCSNHSGMGNRIFYIDRDGVENHYWGGNGSCALNGASNSFGDDTLEPAAMWEHEFPECSALP